MSARMTHVATFVDDETLDRLNKYCHDYDRSRAWTIRKAIMHALNEVEENNLDLAEVDAVA